jgi:hypothetical protein
MIESIILALLVVFYLMVAWGVHVRSQQMRIERPGSPALATMGQGALLWPSLLGYELARYATSPMWVDAQEAAERERVHDNPTEMEP